MIAIIFQGSRVVGTNEDIQACYASTCEYVIVESLPPIFEEWAGSGKDLFFEDEEYRLVDRAPIPPTEVDVLKAQVDDLKAQLEVTNATVDFLLGI